MKITEKMEKIIKNIENILGNLDTIKCEKCHIRNGKYKYCGTYFCDKCLDEVIRG